MLFGGMADRFQLIDLPLDGLYVQLIVGLRLQPTSLNEEIVHGLSLIGNQGS